jgi:hypothetical protein
LDNLKTKDVLQQDNSQIQFRRRNAKNFEVSRRKVKMYPLKKFVALVRKKTVTSFKTLIVGNRRCATPATGYV